ncbi:MAG: hypothetical protein V8T51_00560 [Senegalimassilia faecalis]
MAISWPPSTATTRFSPRWTSRKATSSTSTSRNGGVVGKKYWEYALYTAAHEALPQNLAPGLIMAGDVNGLGMEPAAISGIYAANKILGKTVD